MEHTNQNVIMCSLIDSWIESEFWIPIILQFWQTKYEVIFSEPAKYWNWL